MYITSLHVATHIRHSYIICSVSLLLPLKYCYILVLENEPVRFYGTPFTYCDQYGSVHKSESSEWLVCMQERILLDAMFDVPGTDIVEVVLTEDVVRGGKSPEYVRRSPVDCEEAETASAELRRSSV